jgi:glycosyltransferase involved in cell wall biosynthesis
MKIIFDLREVGLGHNGGSLTLIKSGNALHDLGHEVTFIDSGRNQNKWEKLKPKHIIARNENQIPDADAIIATGYKSVGPTVKAPKRCGVKAIWIRAWETWQMPDEQIVKKVLKAPIHKIVNSTCLYNKLKQYGVESDIIRPGYDFEQLYPRSIRQFNKDPIIGGLYREGIHGNRKRTQWLFETVKTLRAQGVSFQFWLMGSEKQPNDLNIDRYLKQPTMEEKNDFYNYVSIWMSPTMSEGLHLVPAEAGLTGCPAVATNAPLSGTQDYVIHQKTGYVTENNLKSFIDGVDIMIHNSGLRREYGQAMIQRLHEIGGREKNMKKLITVINTFKG